MLKYIKLGNSKISEVVARFDLPTSVCGDRCRRCYAFRSEYLYPRTLEFRNRCLELSQSPEFVSTIDQEIKESQRKLFRIHTSGEFYNQEYLDKWIEIMKRNMEVVFFGWSRKFGKLDFSKLPTNCNIMDSVTPLGLNYGTKEFVGKLVEEHGYFLCPDGGTHDVCFHYGGCDACLTKKKVCFIIH